MFSIVVSFAVQRATTQPPNPRETVYRVSSKMRETDTVKAKFHYATWFGAGSELVRGEIWPIT